MVGLDSLDDEWFTYDSTSHRIEIIQSGDILKDTTQAWEDSPNVTNGNAGATFHVWKYFYDKIAMPIKNKLDTTIINNGDTLKNVIRYIVLCKGIPFRLQARYDWSGINNLPPHHNVSLQSLLSILGNDDYYDLLLDLFNGVENYNNPYYAVDYNLTMNFRFLPNYFKNNYGIYLSYLVTRLDGLSYSNTIQMIENALNADKSGQRTWILDDDPGAIGPSTTIRDKLTNLDFEVYYDGTSNFITENSIFNDAVIAYSSPGTHADSDPPADYIQSLLEFFYAPGAVFNTFESFNGNCFGELKRREGAEMGQLTEFIKMGGTGGVCYPWEPGGFNGNIVYGTYFFPLYAVGYNLVDAVFMDMPNILFQNVVVGDPLTTIAWGKQTIKQNTEMAGVNLVTDTISVQVGDTLFIESNASINMKINGFITGSGTLIFDDNASLYSSDWQSSLLLASENNHPKLVWSTNPGMSPVDYYKVFRKVGIGSWKQVDSTTSNQFLDTSLVFVNPNGGL
ncbi:MAG: hypothetical protein Kow0098_15840 [Ignavibacteriaceae bacterium]